MPSPFPGMNPYLEQASVWHDFHERFCPTVAEVLTSQVRPDYIVKIDEHVFIHELPDQRRGLLGRGDVTIASQSDQGTTSSATATIAAPAQVLLPAVDSESLSFLEIRDRDTMRLVTVIELLSPSNKQSGPDREQYVGKRSRLLNSAVHFVEIDLLRGGPRMPMKDLGECDYYVLVSRYQERPQAGVWPIQLRDPLPVIPIPLQPPHDDARLDLQKLLHRVYDAAAYEDYVYRGTPEPALEATDMEWSRQLCVQNQ
ncbi:MAG: DUF4058 family protein [Planctomycetota bacterium]|nr:DUF4058 family protein [Planctomycetota bacterium]